MTKYILVWDVGYDDIFIKLKYLISEDIENNTPNKIRYLRDNKIYDKIIYPIG